MTFSSKRIFLVGLVIIVSVGVLINLKDNTKGRNDCSNQISRDIQLIKRYIIQNVNKPNVKTTPAVKTTSGKIRQAIDLKQLKQHQQNHQQIGKHSNIHPVKMNEDLIKIGKHSNIHPVKMNEDLIKKLEPEKSPTKIDCGAYEEEPSHWLDRSDTGGFNNYGDGSCEVNSDREGFKLLLNKWVEITNKHKIRYFLEYGTLLGAWRNRDVIPYDADVDIRIHIDDFVKLLPMREMRRSWDSYDDYDFHYYVTKDWALPYRMRRRFNCGGEQVKEYEGQCSFTDPYARLIHRIWHLDIFVYTYYHQTLKFLPENGFEFLKGDVLPLVRCKFMDIETRCPKRPVKILREHYESLSPKKICMKGKWYEEENR